MIKTFFTPITRISVSSDFPQSIDLGGVRLIHISDAEALQYLRISGRKFGPKPSEFGFTCHGQNLTAGAIMDELEAIDVFRSTHAFVSELPLDKHQCRVDELLHCWRLLRISRVCCPVTYNSDSPGVNMRQPIQCRLGDNLNLDPVLFSETKSLLRNLRHIPFEDLEIIDLANKTGYKTLSVLFLVMIAESSLMKNDKNKISFKVSSYGSRLLQFHDDADITDVLSVMREAYSIRSTFVHAGGIQHLDLEAFLPRLYRYVARIRILTALPPDVVSPEAK